MMPTPSQLEKGEKLPLPSSGSSDYLLRPSSPSSSSSSPPIVTRLGCWARASAMKRTAIVLTVLAIVGVAFQQVSCRLHLKHICPRPAMIEFILPAEDHFVFDAPSLYSPDPILAMSEADELASTWASPPVGMDAEAEADSLDIDAGLDYRPGEGEYVDGEGVSDREGFRL